MASVGFDPATTWSSVARSNHWATAPHIWVYAVDGLLNKDESVIPDTSLYVCVYPNNAIEIGFVTHKLNWIRLYSFQKYILNLVLMHAE